MPGKGTGGEKSIGLKFHVLKADVTKIIDQLKGIQSTINSDFSTLTYKLDPASKDQIIKELTALSKNVSGNASIATTAMVTSSKRLQAAHKQEAQSIDLVTKAENQRAVAAKKASQAAKNATDKRLTHLKSEATKLIKSKSRLQDDNLTPAERKRIKDDYSRRSQNYQKYRAETRLSAKSEAELSQHITTQMQKYGVEAQKAAVSDQAATTATLERAEATEKLAASQEKLTKSSQTDNVASTKQQTLNMQQTRRAADDAAKSMDKLSKNSTQAISDVDAYAKQEFTTLKRLQTRTHTLDKEMLDLKYSDNFDQSKYDKLAKERAKTQSRFNEHLANSVQYLTKEQQATLNQRTTDNAVDIGERAKAYEAMAVARTMNAEAAREDTAATQENVAAHKDLQTQSQADDGAAAIKRAEAQQQQKRAVEETTQAISGLDRATQSAGETTSAAASENVSRLYELQGEIGHVLSDMEQNQSGDVFNSEQYDDDVRRIAELRQELDALYASTKQYMTEGQEYTFATNMAELNQDWQNVERLAAARQTDADAARDEAAATAELADAQESLNRSSDGSSSVNVRQQEAQAANAQREATDAATEAQQRNIDATERATQATEQQTQATEEQAAAQKEAKDASDAKSKADDEAAAKQEKLQKLMLQMNNYGSKYGQNLQHNAELQRKFNELMARAGDSSTDIKQLSRDWTEFKLQCQNAGIEVETLGQKINRLLGSGLTQRLRTMIGMAAVTYTKQLWNDVKEIDAAMTELRKVTDETDATYNRFIDTAKARAKDIGATMGDVIKSTADFARLGYNLGEASTLADAAIVFKNVGDGLSDIDDASEKIISIVKAFPQFENNSMSVVDKMNEVGNRFAITSKGIGEALQRSAGALTAAHNTLDESIALAVGMNAVTQDPVKVGTSLKTLSMYLRAAKTEAEDAGESTDGMAESVSKLRDEILALTGNKVDLYDQNGDFKSTIQIMRELSSVWQELSDISQANILERIGGKRNASIIASLLQNFQETEKALKVSQSAEGSALRENEKYLDSIQGRLVVLKATGQAIATDLLDPASVKVVMGSIQSVATGIEKITNALGGIPTALLSGGLFAAFKNLD